MRSKGWHRLGLAALVGLALVAPRADAQSPEFAASFARATTALYQMVNVPAGDGIPREVQQHLPQPIGVAFEPRRRPGVVVHDQVDALGAGLLGEELGDLLHDPAQVERLRRSRDIVSGDSALALYEL